MYVRNVNSHIRRTLDLRRNKLNAIFRLHAKYSYDLLDALFGSALFMHPANVACKRDVYHLAYIGEDGSISRTKENFVNFIRERKEVKLKDLLEAFAMGSSTRMKVHLFQRMFAESSISHNFKMCPTTSLYYRLTVDALKECLPADEFDLSELDGAEHWAALLCCSIRWIGGD